MQFEVGRLVARIQVDGMQTFGRDLSQAGTEFSKLDEKGRLASERLGRSLVGVGLAITSLVALAIARFAAFDKAMSSAGAVIDGFTDKQRELRQAALDAGAVTVFTATEAANAEAELGRAGINASNIIGGALVGSLALAAAGQIEVSQAAEVTASTLNQFRLSGEKATHVADLLAAGANKAQGGVGDLAMALKQSGLVASQMGLSVEDTVGTLTAFASAGLIGSDAGTSFRQMLLNLATPTKQQTELMDRYNIAAYDRNSGEFIGIQALAEKIKTAKFATQAERDYALGVIFGSDAIRAANILYTQGAEGIAGYTDAVNDSGAAARLAGELQDNLAGDVEKLGGAFDSALIQTGEGANGILRDMVQTLTDLVDAYGDLPAPVQQGVLGIGLLAGAVTLFGGVLLLTIPKIVEFRLALATLQQQVPALGGALGKVGAFLSGPWGVALVAAALGISLLQTWADSMKASSDELTASLIAQKASAESIFATYTKGSGGLIGTAGTLDKIQEAINAVDESKNPFAFFTDTTGLNQTYTALQKVGDGLGELAKNDLPTAQARFRDFVAQTDGTTESQWRLLLAMDGYKQQLIATGTANGTYSETMTEAQKKTALLELAQGNAAQATEYMAGQYDDAAISVGEVTLSIDELIDALNEANGVQISAEEASIRYADQLREVAAAAVESNAGISLATEEGTRNRDMLIALAEAGQKAAEANLNAGGTAQQYAAELEASRAAFIQQAIDLGATADEANALADSIYKIPSKKEIEIIAQTKNAMKTMDDFINAYKNRQIPISAVVRAADRYSSANGNIFYADGGIEAFASGGMSERHVAQIAGAGKTRVWAEPETGGEAYIPLASDKRARSEAILNDVASMFGYDLVKVKGDGGGSGTSSSGGSREVRMTGELILVDGKAYIEGIVVDKLERENDTLGKGATLP